LGNQSDSTPPLNNQAVWTWDSGTLSDQAVGVVILEPDLYITKEVDLRTIYPGQLRTFTITIGHTGASQTSAFNVEITDIIPVELDYQPVIRHISGPAPSEIDDSNDPTLYIRWDEFPNTGTPAVFEIDVMLESSITREDIDQRFTNNASVSWSSLLGDFSAAQSPHNPLSTERFYDPVSNINIYETSDGITVWVPALPDTGFAPGKITPLPIQSEDLSYGDLDGLWVEIPDLGISVPIVSIPQSDQGWDLTWLWNQAGWLEGTAYPSWYGNTVITGHAYLSNGLPGPFVGLEKLSWGDEIFLYAHGLKYSYQVRLRNKVSAYDLSILDHKDQDWLTLFTCQEYNEITDQYNWRQVIQAVLIDVEQIQ
jgi:LPXTG-site transpeptidase (sortase) family protein